jgi:superfamily II DNA helicase RecQ
MKLVIDSANAVSGTSLHLQIRGVHIEANDISGKLAITDDSGRISIEILPSKEELSKQTVLFEQALEEAPVATEKPEFALVSDISSNTLFQKLVALRRDIAKEANVPPYIIFHDTTLKDMASKLPVDLDSMREISGVGNTKLEKYGSKFVAVIKGYLADSA